MEKSRRHRASWPRRLFLMLIIVGICWPNLGWGQGDQRVPLELKVKIKDREIGRIFVDSLKNWINRSNIFVLSTSKAPRIVLHINSQGILELPYQSVIAVIWTVTAPGKEAPKEIFQDYIVMIGVSAAHAGKDAEDILNYTQEKILPPFTAIKGEKKSTP